MPPRPLTPWQTTEKATDLPVGIEWQVLGDIHVRPARQFSGRKGFSILHPLAARPQTWLLVSKHCEQKARLPHRTRPHHDDNLSRLEVNGYRSNESDTISFYNPIPQTKNWNGGCHRLKS